ncbi:MAG: 23S rRNA (pseudouridine(1915)-N(3))-methyltransferase RlmH, partial [Chitinophagia bacterium]|nr:23S rRNA (pseudouridine(1915)-N(3))-methyltransferase RlmH [Chitinophagia bacterium]
MQIEIWSIGKESDSYIHEGVSQYIEKMAPW